MGTLNAVVTQFQIPTGGLAFEWRHPERSRSSGGAKDLRCDEVGDPSARWRKRGRFGMTPLESRDLNLSHYLGFQVLITRRIS